MGVLIDLVQQAQPALYGGGFTGSATIGRSWKFPFVDTVDADGEVVDLSSVTGVCKVLTAPGGTEIITLPFTGHADGSFELTATKAATAAITAAANTSSTPAYCWYLTLDDGTDSVQVWGASESKFVLKKGV